MTHSWVIHGRQKDQKQYCCLSLVCCLFCCGWQCCFFVIHGLLQEPLILASYALAGTCVQIDEVMHQTVVVLFVCLFVCLFLFVCSFVCLFVCC